MITLTFNQSSDAGFMAYWLPWLPQESVPDLATVSLVVRVGFADPVLLDFMTGGVYSLKGFEVSAGKSRFGNLPLADYPLAIAERSELALKP